MPAPSTRGNGSRSSSSALHRVEPSNALSLVASARARETPRQIAPAHDAGRAAGTAAMPKRVGLETQGPTQLAALYLAKDGQPPERLAEQIQRSHELPAFRDGRKTAAIRASARHRATSSTARAKLGLGQKARNPRRRARSRACGRSYLGNAWSICPAAAAKSDRRGPRRVSPPIDAPGQTDAERRWT